MGRIKKRSGRRSHLPEVTLTPLIDTALTLLIIFMIATPMMQNSIKISLPEGKVKEADDQRNPLIVALDKNNKIVVGGKPVAASQLVDYIGKHVAGKTKQTVFVHADKATNYGHVIKIVDELKRIKGVSYVALSTARAA